ncbi:UNKNOWN [Stylonychia lemnae]|uniref:Uncharacterized protein n=1 Tax=Stylonychia lemnae TaxID=5949 RepID=A0A078ASW3_STYLE|nr:UNKNOWN [Stylonychia lemnae]|eukprot:CDW85555.1 UNKNOWN [Stylonychia lemnae]
MNAKNLKQIQQTASCLKNNPEDQAFHQNNEPQVTEQIGGLIESIDGGSSNFDYLARNQQQEEKQSSLESISSFDNETEQLRQDSEGKEVSDAQIKVQFYQIKIEENLSPQTNERQSELREKILIEEYDIENEDLQERQEKDQSMEISKYDIKILNQTNVDEDKRNLQNEQLMRSGEFKTKDQTFNESQDDKQSGHIDLKKQHQQDKSISDLIPSLDNTPCMKQPLQQNGENAL